MDRKNSEEWQSRLARTVNSAACFSLAYTLLTYMYWLVTGLTGKLFGFDSFVYYYGIKFILNGQSWDKYKIAMVYCSGSFFMLFAALIAYFLYSKLRTIRTMLNVFLLWTFVIGICLFVAQFIIATLGMYHYDSFYYQAFAVAFSWLKISKALIIIIDILLVLFIVYLGANIARPFMMFAFSYSKVNNLKRKRRYFFETALAPFMLGYIVSLIAVSPKDIAAKNVLVLLASSQVLYFLVLAIVLFLGSFSLAYIEIKKSEIIRYKSFQLPSLVFWVLMMVAWALVYITFGGYYIKG